MKKQHATIKPFLTIGCLLICLLSVIPAHLLAQNEKLDRLKLKIPELSGQEKLDSLRYLVNQYLFTEEGLSILETYEKEAIAQNKPNEIAHAKRKAVQYYYYQPGDTFYIVAADAEEYARKYKVHTSLFSIIQNIIQRYANNGEYAIASQKAKAMYEEAHELNDTKGIASAIAALANIYNSLGMTDEALSHYKESLAVLQTTQALDPLYLNLYGMIIHSYYVKDDSEHMLLYADSLEMKLNEITAADPLNKFEDLRYLITQHRATAYLKKDMPHKAWEYIQMTDSLYQTKVLAPLRRYSINSLKLNYYNRIGDYETAIIYGEEAIAYLKEQDGLSLEFFRHYSNQAENYLTLGKYKESAELYKDAVDVMESYYPEAMDTQLNQLRTFYELDKLEMQAQKDKLQINLIRQRFSMLTVVFILLSFIFLLVITYMRRIQKKNIGLVQQIQEQDQLKEENERLKEEVEKAHLFHYTEKPMLSDELPDQDALIIKLKSYLKETSAYTDPSVNRKTLAEKLGTNENYLRTAVKEKLGYTISEYINEFRISHAKKLLALSGEQYSIDEVAAESGFGTRSTLYRQFKNKYGLSPDEYRKSLNKL